jgi:1,2-diacylglycerol 3-beta-glucosyltransferase
VALPSVLIGLYLLLLTLLSGVARLPGHSSRLTRFDVVVPAHDEESAIGAAVASLSQVDWPADRFRVLVVADNCADATAERARTAGAVVLERSDLMRRGKGYALEAAFQSSRDQGWATAVVVVDADSVVSPGLLEAFATRIERGAGAVQAHYAVLNAQASWRTRLMAIALASFHRVRSRARERLRWSCGLRGNGWCVTHEVLLQVPYRAFSLAEDLEFGIELGIAGQRVHYADEAYVAAEMVSGAEAAASQRQRWEHGRLHLLRSKTAMLLQAAGHADRRFCLDLVVDLLVPPLSYVALAASALVIIGALGSSWLPFQNVLVWSGFACALAVVLYVLRGWQLSGVGLRGLLDLGRAPVFVLWKTLLMLRPHSATRWIRTKREQP